MLDITSVHPTAYEAVYSAVVESPNGPGFGLDDIASEAHWMALLRMGFGNVAVEGALHGAVAALRARAADVADVLSYPRGQVFASVTTEDFAIASGWLTSALHEGLDDAALTVAVNESLSSRGWERDATRITSLVLAVASVAGHAADHDH